MFRHEIQTTLYCQAKEECPSLLTIPRDYPSIVVLSVWVALARIQFGVWRWLIWERTCSFGKKVLTTALWNRTGP